MANPVNIHDIKVLMYHRVMEQNPGKNSHWHYVTVDDFKRQMHIIDYLGFTPITFYDYKLYLEDKLTLPAKPIIITFDDGYLDIYEHALPVLLELNMKAVLFVMGNRNLEIADWDEDTESDNCRLMSDDQIRTALELDFEIGAHSLNHQKLLELSDWEATHEIRESKKEIEEVLKAPIHTFAYPYGSVDERIKRIIKTSDYSFACGVYTGSPKFGETRFDFRRLAINQQTSMFNFLLKLLLPYQYAEWLYHRAKTRGMQEVPVKEHANPSTNGKDQFSHSFFERIFNSNFF